MKISIDESYTNEEIEVIIKGSKENKLVKRLYQTLQYYDQTITGFFEHKRYLIPLNQIYYFDSTDDKTFAYTKDCVYDVQFRLYQLESFLEETPFLRINKHTILNLKKIHSFHSTINGRMEAKLINEERMKISRNYVKSLKRALGGNRK